jgi:hypothetical protein
LSSRGPRTPQKLYYTVGELARIAEVSDYRMRNLLRSNEVPVGKSGQNARRGVVYVASLARALPDLMDSITMMKTEGGDE